uniref:Phenazine biosynthesis-like domain-containing protein n=2 Tax=Aegilops tauschii subsp. strangulata TaxID=200361 RepID=A0A452Y093_AEGTS
PAFFSSRSISNLLHRISTSIVFVWLLACTQVDAFTGEPFKGNPAAACLLDDDDRWLQSVAAEFNVSQTAFLFRRDGGSSSSSTPRFRLRWFSPRTEVPLCGHGTLASAHFLFTAVLAKQQDVIEFVTESGILTAWKVPGASSRPRVTEEEQAKPFIELDFPTSDVLVDCSSTHELPSIFLKAAPIVGVHRGATTDDFIVGPCLWQCTLCSSTILGPKTGQTKTDGVSSI